MAGRGDYSTRQIIHSDESHSTERDQNTMSTTYDYDDINDQQSIISDSISVASNNHQLQHSKKADYKKMIMKLNRLKEENAVLREHLEKAKAQDVATLRAQLRGANVDLLRYKQLNAELKERIQSVEAKLFTALGLLGEVNNKKSVTSGATSAIDVPHSIDDEFQDAKDGSVDASVSVAAKHIHASDIDDLVERSRSNLAKQRVLSSKALTKSLQSQCSHLQRLTASYEKRIQAMQRELDSHYHTRSTPHKSVVINEGSSSGGEAADTEVHSQLNDYKLSSEVSGDDDSIQSMSRRNSWTESNSREEGGAADKRIIRELSSEIKRLVSLIPREALHRMEEQQQQQQEEASTASFEVPPVTSQSPMDEIGSTDPSKTIHPSSSSPERKESPSTHHWILSFVLGCLMSFFGIALLHTNDYVVVNWSVSALSKAR